MRDAGLALGQAFDVGLADMHAMGQVHIRPEPLQLIEQLDGPDLVPLQTITLFVQGLGCMGM